MNHNTENKKEKGSTINVETEFNSHWALYTFCLVKNHSYT